MIPSGPWFRRGLNLGRVSPKVVTISPGGYKGYYLLGVCSYIRDHFSTEGCFFSGASAGSWFSLLMTYRGNHTELLEELGVLKPNFVHQNLKQMQRSVSRTLVEKYTDTDFDLKRLFVGVTRFRPFYVDTDIYSDFHDLKDAVSCCKASSHIPLITGGLVRTYDREWTFDGGFSVYPYLNDSEPSLHICTEVWFDDKEKRRERWNRQNPLWKNVRLVMEQTTLFSRDQYHLLELYRTGYEDSARNHATLAQIFPSRHKKRLQNPWRRTKKGL
jgi:hypothetical protein